MDDLPGFDAQFRAQIPVSFFCAFEIERLSFGKPPAGHLQTLRYTCLLEMLPNTLFVIRKVVAEEVLRGLGDLGKSFNTGADGTHHLPDVPISSGVGSAGIRFLRCKRNGQIDDKVEVLLVQVMAVDPGQLLRS